MTGAHVWNSCKSEQPDAAHNKQHSRPRKDMPTACNAMSAHTQLKPVVGHEKGDAAQRACGREQHLTCM